MSGPLIPVGSTTVITGSNAGNNSVSVPISVVEADDLGAVKSIAGAAPVTNLYAPVNGVYLVTYIGVQTGGTGSGQASGSFNRLNNALGLIAAIASTTNFLGGGGLNQAVSGSFSLYLNAGEVLQVIPSCGATGSAGNNAWRIGMTLLHQSNPGSAPQVI